jgi:hypothetical protein
MYVYIYIHIYIYTYIYIHTYIYIYIQGSISYANQVRVQTMQTPTTVAGSPSDDQIESGEFNHLNPPTNTFAYKKIPNPILEVDMDTATPSVSAT